MVYHYPPFTLLALLRPATLDPYQFFVTTRACHLTVPRQSKVLQLRPPFPNPAHLPVNYSYIQLSRVLNHHHPSVATHPLVISQKKYTHTRLPFHPHHLIPGFRLRSAFLICALAILILAHTTYTTTPFPPVASTSSYMSDLRQRLARLGLSQYLEVFTAEGFDTWDTVLDITESDL